MFHGLTWDHPRGYDALAEAARQVNATRAEPLIHWDKQPLEGFESAPIADLAARYDLLVLDHPHIGEAVAEDCLIPLEELFDASVLASWRAGSIGPSLYSYHWQDRTYGVPLDVATQVMARRADIVAEPPETWEDVEELAGGGGVALSIGGPHAFLNLISMAAGEGHIVGGDELLPDAAALPALERLARLAALAPPGSEDLNPIRLLETMAHGDEIALVPLIFGYVTYSEPGYAPHPIRFSESIRSESGRGGVLGGTGIGFTRRARPSPALLDHIAWLMETQTQSTFLPAHRGQPSARAAWESEAVNAACGAFYRETMQTAERALLRPRFDGYVTFQSGASTLIRGDILSRRDPVGTLSDLRTLWRDARRTARGNLDDNRTQQ